LTTPGRSVTYPLDIFGPVYRVTKVGSGCAHFFFFSSMSAIGLEPVAEQARRLLEPIIAREGYELVEVEWAREGPVWVLRLFVDRPGGVTIEHCQELSRTVEPVLDVEDFLSHAYNLEVSSPGLERPLRKPADFDRFAGQRVRVKTFGPVESPSGPRKNWTGTLRGFKEGAVEIEVDGVLHRVPHDKIAKAHLEYDFGADVRKKE
jgi:ribosome maturation factor RimP